jgi:heme oxygenase
MAHQYDWVDLNSVPHQLFLKGEAEYLYEQVQELSKFQREAEAQAKYIKELEKQVSILQKTLDCVYENRCLRRRLHNGRQAHVYQKNNR